MKEFLYKNKKVLIFFFIIVVAFPFIYWYKVLLE